MSFFSTFQGKQVQKKCLRSTPEIKEMLKRQTTEFNFNEKRIATKVHPLLKALPLINN